MYFLCVIIDNYTDSFFYFDEYKFVKLNEHGLGKCQIRRFSCVLVRKKKVIYKLTTKERIYTSLENMFVLITITF